MHIFVFVKPLKVLSVFFVLLLAFAVYADPKDSVRTELIRGKRYIIHRVEKGQGLYAIARRYGVEAKQVTEANAEKSGRFKKGDLIRVPLMTIDTSARAVKEDGKSKSLDRLPVEKINIDSLKPAGTRLDEAHANADVKEAAKSRTHTVVPGETVNKIAQKYKITPQLLVKWNGIRDNRIDVGQELIIDGSLVIKPYEKWNAPNSITARSNIPQNIVATTEIVEESGFAGTDETGMVLHKTAPAGTLMLITNIDNGKQAYVKVSGKLDDQLKNVVILLDDVTKQMLGPSTGLIRVNLKYALPAQ